MLINPVSNNSSVIRYKNWRITIIKDGLIRLEKSDECFHDLPTQMVLNRYFVVPNFKYEITDHLVIKLSYYSLHLFDSLENSYIIYNEQTILLNNSYNLGGTYSTVDGMDGDRCIFHEHIDPIRQIGVGVCSKNGLAVLDDSSSYCFDENMEFLKMNPDDLDIYLFFYPNDYKNAVKSFYDISGYPPKLPKKIFGNWWSRYYAYTQESYLHLMDSFIEENVPFTVATIDMDWHYSSSNGRVIFDDLEIPREEFIKDGKYICSGWDDNNHMSLGWTGFIWNKKLFSDYKKLFNDLKERNLSVTLNIHPNDGVAFYEEPLYSEIAKELNINVDTKENIPFDFTDRNNRNAFFKHIFNKYENDGVAFWWIDWQQGEVSKLKGLKPIWLCNHYFYQNRALNEQRPLILSRYCGAGGQRYPLGFSGDSLQTYDSLDYLVKTTPMASNIGFTYWSHDVGGHMMGQKDGELFLKFVQFAVFSPVVRLHCSCEETYDKNPKVFMSGYGELVKKYLRLRHRMIPSLYSYMLKTSCDGSALLEPMYYQYPDEENSYKYSDGQYFFMNDLLVAPYTKPANKNGYTTKEVFFPLGTYYDINYGYKYKGNSVVKVSRTVDDVPVFIKEGAFFVLDNKRIGNSISNPTNLEIITSIGTNYLYNLYEDDEQNKTIITSFGNKVVNNKSVISIKITNDKDLFIQKRTYKFKILNVHNLVDIKVLNATLLKCYQDESLEITISNLEYDLEAQIIIETNKISELDEAKLFAQRRIAYLDDDNMIRSRLYYAINDASSIDDIFKLVSKSKLKMFNKKLILEVLEFKK